MEFNMKTKEELAKEYAQGKSSSLVFQEAHIEDFLAGYDAASEWIEFDGKNTPNDKLMALKFDDGTICLSDSDSYPFAVMTHFKIL